MEQKKSLLTKEFIILNTILFTAASAMAMFFYLQSYFKSLGIAFKWFGFLMGADSLASFVLQPFLAIHLNAVNARKWLFIGISGMVVMLLSYKFSLSLYSLIAVRILNGAVFVCLISAIVAMMVNYIPSEKSGQAFGLISIVRLIPYSIVPPVITATVKTPSEFHMALVCSAALMMFFILPAYRIKPPETAGQEQEIKGDQPGIKMQGLSFNLKDRNIIAILAVNLLLYSAYTIVFFFIKEYSQTKGIENPGYFFTISTAVMIGIRLLGGTFFDKINKATASAISMACLAICYIMLAYIQNAVMFYIIAFFTGLGWGVGIPILNALLFDVSPTRFRGTNLNLSIVMMQCGFFIGPFLGGVLINHSGYVAAFYLCSIMSMSAAVIIKTIITGGYHESR